MSTFISSANFFYICVCLDIKVIKKNNILLKRKWKWGLAEEAQVAMFSQFELAG